MHSTAGGLATVNRAYWWEDRVCAAEGQEEISARRGQRGREVMLSWRQAEAARFICAIWDNSGGQTTRLMVNKEAFMNFTNFAFLKMKSLEFALAERRHHKCLSIPSWWYSHKRKQKKEKKRRGFHNDRVPAAVDFLSSFSKAVEWEVSVAGSSVRSLQFANGAWGKRAPSFSSAPESETSRPRRVPLQMWPVWFLRTSQHQVGALPTGTSWISPGGWNKASRIKTQLEDRPVGTCVKIRNEQQFKFRPSRSTWGFKP